MTDQTDLVEAVARACAASDDETAGARYTNYWADMARAALAAIEAAGWRVVPVEPTEAMKVAGLKQAMMAEPDGFINQAIAAYVAMLAAAPKP